MLDYTWAKITHESTPQLTHNTISTQFVHGLCLNQSTRFDLGEKYLILCIQRVSPKKETKAVRGKILPFFSLIPKAFVVQLLNLLSGLTLHPLQC